MPRIASWAELPPNVRQHLLDRMRDRAITLSDLNQLRLWIESQPEVPEGEWYKDFGSFKICGAGGFPSPCALPANLPLCFQQLPRCSFRNPFLFKLLHRCPGVVGGLAKRCFGVLLQVTRHAQFTPTRRPVFSMTYTLPNLQALCFDNVATVGWSPG